MVSKFEKKVIQTIGPNRENDKVAHQILGSSYASIQNAKGRVVKDFEESLDLLIDYYPVFDRRLRMREPEIHIKLRKLARLIYKD